MQRPNANPIRNKMFARNMIVAGILVLIIVLILLITLGKLLDGNIIEGFDHTYRNSLIINDAP